MARIEVPKPRFPKVPAKISLEDILPAIRTIARRKHHSYEYPGFEVKPGRKYLLLCDSTNDKMVMEAIGLAIREAGGVLNTVVVEGYPQMTESIDLLDTMFSRNWFPAWVWQAIAETDVLIMGAFLLGNYTPNTPVDIKDKDNVMMYLTPDVCLPQVQGFPFEVRHLLDVRTWEMMVNGKTMEMTDLEGTQLRWSMTRQSWDETVKRNRINFGVDHYPGHLMVPVMTGEAEGKLVTSAITFGGPAARTAMTVKASQVVKVEGQGRLPDVLRQSFEEFKQVKSPNLPGPGINWWTTLAIGTSPKCRPAANWDKLTGSARMHAWGLGHSRSGVIHTSVGEAVVSHDRRIIRHMNLFFPTLVCDGRTVIDKGHLVALDDPEVIRLAAKYGDPEHLLREDWIPAVQGVNA